MITYDSLASQRIRRSAASGTSNDFTNDILGTIHKHCISPLLTATKGIAITRSFVAQVLRVDLRLFEFRSRKMNEPIRNLLRCAKGSLFFRTYRAVSIGISFTAQISWCVHVSLLRCGSLLTARAACVRSVQPGAASLRC